jgi:hypothetical protein
MDFTAYENAYPVFQALVFMTKEMIIAALKSEILAAEEVLNTQYSFELAEPNYNRCLEIIKSAPELQPEFSELLISLLESEAVSDEPVAYLMRVLRWEEVRAWAKNELALMSDVMITGVVHLRVLEAYEADWENEEFYARFLKDKES